jgi:dTDP-4-dehydrorhamnose 3,5-epimerase
MLVRLDPQRDARGSFTRIFCEEELRSAGIQFRVVQANLSSNAAARTLRGLHYQRPPFGEPKIVSCLRGRIWDVAVDLREESPTYRKWHGVELAPETGNALLMPEGVAHGFLTLEPDSEIHYLMGAAYVPEAASGVRWDDPALAIEWPGEPDTISERDRSFPLLPARP